MLSNKEVQIGSSMAKIFAFAVIPSFLIQAFALDPANPGYDATWGPVISVLNVVTGFALLFVFCLLYTSPSPRDRTRSRMPSSA